jgi:predicted unusual protein kinase regulating ubiquinone biosynthesis (AarF/ABC1/UbiB family)
MLTEELDFKLEARYTEIFRRIAKKHKYVSAPKLYPDLCDHNILVTEFVAGVFLNEILNALERHDPAEIEKLMARGFRPKKLSKRMMNVFHWECFESLFFHADPHPANIIVRPDNTMVMIDFGSCGSVSSRMKRKLMQFNRHMANEDLHGMVQNTISMLEPLPHFDVDSFTIDLTTIYREIFIALKSKHSPWYDKCSGAMWMRVIGLSQKYNLPMTLDTVRIFRASFMYDSIIYRLNPKLDPVKEYAKWARHWDAKNRRNSERWVLKRLFGPLDSDFTKGAETVGIFEHALDRLQGALDRPSYNFGFTIGKVAYVMTVLIKTTVLTISSVLLISLIRMLTTFPALAGADPGSEFGKALFWTVNNQIFLIAVIVYFVIATRKILFRLQDVDVDQD